jgi:hypothetical protein
MRFSGQRSDRSKSIRADCPPFGMAAAKAVESRHPISFGLSPKREHVASLGAELDVMPGHRSLDSSRLVRPLQMSREFIAVLMDLDVLLDGLAVIDVFRIDRPVAPNIVGRLFLG